MDFQRLNRRELQSLCKLNKIPANITNVAMIDALNLLEIVVGIEDLMKASESSEKTESYSVESEILSPRITRTGCRTSTRQNPVRDEAESVQTVMRTTRRGVTRQIAGEVEDAKTATVLKKTARKVSLNEESVYGRTYSTRRSARLTEVKVAEPSPVENEIDNLEKIDSSSTKSFEEMLEEGSDCFNAVAEDPSLSVGIENTSEIMEPEKEKTSSVDTDMGIEDNTMAIDVKNEKIVDFIASENEESKLETVGKINSHEDMDLVRVVAADDVEEDLEKGNSAAEEENKEDDFEFPVLCPVDIEFGNEEMSKESGDESVMDISDDKENIDQNELEQLTKDVGMKTKKDNDQLKDISLRQLTKMLKNKLQITSSVNTAEEEAANITVK